MVAALLFQFLDKSVDPEEVSGGEVATKELPARNLLPSREPSKRSTNLRVIKRNDLSPSVYEETDFSEIQPAIEKLNSSEIDKKILEKTAKILLKIYAEVIEIEEMQANLVGDEKGGFVYQIRPLKGEQLVELQKKVSAYLDQISSDEQIRLNVENAIETELPFIEAVVDGKQVELNYQQMAESEDNFFRVKVDVIDFQKGPFGDLISGPTFTRTMVPDLMPKRWSHLVKREEIDDSDETGL